MTSPVSASALMSAAQTLNNHSLYWMPEYLVPSSGVAQAPLVFWLMDLLRPEQAISFGGHAGVVHLAQCQGARDLALDCNCLLHLARPANEPFMRLSRQDFSAYSQPLAGLETLAVGQTDLICVHIGDAAQGQETDWDALRQALAPGGVMMLYGAAVDAVHAPLPRLAMAAPEGGRTLRFGQGAEATLLLLGPDAPSDLTELAVSEAGGEALAALLHHQGQHLALECHRRALPRLAPDPTAPELEAPATLEEAQAQIAQLIEIHAEDLDSLGVKLERHSDEVAALKRAHQQELAEVRAELARKDSMLEVLNQRLGDMQKEAEAAQAAPVAPPQPIQPTGRGFGRLRQALRQPR